LNTTTDQKIEILLLESLPENIELVKQTLDQTRFLYNLHTTSTISDTLDFIGKRKAYQNKAKPDIILLNSEPSSDLEKEIIKTVSSENFSSIPVLFFRLRNNHLEISKAINKKIKYQTVQELNIEYFMEAIASLKKFVGSLDKCADQNEYD